MNTSPRWITLGCALALALAWPLASVAQSSAVQRFASPEEAAQALVAALGTDRADAAQLAKLFGNDWHDYVPTEGVDRSDVEAFLQHYRERHSLESGPNDTRLLSVGKEAWTFPVPLVHDAKGWHFDARAGAAEIRARRIGRDETSAVESLRAYHDAQMDYASEDRDGDGVLEYARKFLSTDGLHDGLYWAEDDSGQVSPLGPLFGDATPTGDWHGYHFRILEGQGDSAPGQAYSYLMGDNMSRGFAAIAWPTKYNDTGVMSFMISQEGQVFEKDLGPGSEGIAKGMKRFDPDDSWKVVEDVAAEGASGPL